MPAMEEPNAVHVPKSSTSLHHSILPLVDDSTLVDAFSQQAVRKGSTRDEIVISCKLQSQYLPKHTSTLRRGDFLGLQQVYNASNYESRLTASSDATSASAYLNGIAQENAREAAKQQRLKQQIGEELIKFNKETAVFHSRIIHRSEQQYQRVSHKLKESVSNNNNNNNNIASDESTNPNTSAITVIAGSFQAVDINSFGQVQVQPSIPTTEAETPIVEQPPSYLAVHFGQICSDPTTKRKNKDKKDNSSGNGSSSTRKGKGKKKGK